MRIGCCCNVEGAAIAQAAGFTFIECKVISLLPDETSDAAAAALTQHKSSPLPVAVFNVFLPRDLKVVGPAIDQARLERYIENALIRVWLDFKAEVGPSLEFMRRTFGSP